MWDTHQLSVAVSLSSAHTQVALQALHLPSPAAQVLPASRKTGSWVFFEFLLLYLLMQRWPDFYSKYRSSPMDCVYMRVCV